MHICIIGPGAIGLFLAARLAQQERVTIVGRNLAAPTRQEVRITGVLECQAEVDLSPHPVDADLVMVATKAIHLDAVIPSLKECSAPLVFWQNGLGVNQLLRTQLPDASLIRAYSWMGLAREAPYTVRCNAFSRIAIGSLQADRQNDGDNDDAQLVRAILIQSGLATDMVDDVNRTEWEKSLLNIGINGLCAITGERNGVIVESVHLHKLCVQLVREAQTIARAIGYDLNMEKAVLQLARVTGNNVNSMLQDIQAARMTEIDFLNGHVMRLGQQLGIDTPYNMSIYHLVKHIERA